MDLVVLGADRLRELLPPRAAVDALEAAFAADDRADAPLRTHHATSAGDLLLMPAWGEAGVGVKLVTLTPSNPARGLPLIGGLYALFDPETQRPVGAIDGAALTALRTAAVSALATRHLARPDARRLVVFGAGVQAAAHLEAIPAVRPIEEVRIVSRSPDRAARLAEVARTAGLGAEVVAPDAVGWADVVCTCTTSPTPVLEGARLADGAHVNAVGAYTPETRELDDEAVRRSRVVVETREVALAEAGDLLIPMAAGVIGEEHVVADLGEVVRGARARERDADVTLFKSVGVAFEDLAVARAALDEAAR